jgi:hypothetical protein
MEKVLGDTNEGVKVPLNLVSLRLNCGTGVSADLTVNAIKLVPRL